MDRAASRAIVDVTADARDKEEHALADDKKRNVYTQDDALLSVAAFGHSAGTVRTDRIWQQNDTAKLASTESLF